jgi:glycosyltransferase involved in cell wall biosynthesis
VLAINYLAERRALSCTDNVICLSERDDQILRRLYGRGATHVCPLAIRDTGVPGVGLSRPLPTPYVLFVGGAFYANVEGVRWYADRVAPRLPITTAIVGRGFEAYRSELHRAGSLEVVGEVADLSAWYRHAALVVAPIFDGSGMKTKVAEALMHGKTIVGTPEAFSGYEQVLGRPEWVCHDADEFVRAIRCALAQDGPMFDPDLRSLYDRHYSLEAARTRLASAIGPLT